MVSDTEHSGQFYIRLMESRRVDALIVADTQEDDPRINYLAAKGHPFSTRVAVIWQPRMPGLILIVKNASRLA